VLPGLFLKWISVSLLGGQGLFSTLQTSSGVAYSTLSSLDKDVDREIQDWEIRFERSFGDRKFYSEEEVEKISKEFSELTVVK